MLAQRKVLQPPLADFDLREHALRPFPVRHLPVQRLGDFDEMEILTSAFGLLRMTRDCHSERSALCHSERSEGICPGHFRTHEHRPYLEPRLEAVLQLAAALHHEKTLLPPRLGFFLQQEQILDFRVLRRCDALFPHTSNRRYRHRRCPGVCKGAEPPSNRKIR